MVRRASIEHERYVMSKKTFEQILDQFHSLNQEYQEILEKLDLSPSEIKTTVETKDNFSPDVWEWMQERKQQEQQSLERQLANLRDMSRTQEVLKKQQEVRPHWLFVR